MVIREFLGSLKQKPANSPSSGIFHYRIEDADERSRIHLRLDPDGHGTLIVNANRVMHLNPTAALMAWFVLEKVEMAAAAKALQEKYHVRRSQALADLGNIHDQLKELVRADGSCPIHDLNLETVAPFTERPSAPYRLDLALTYRCNNDCTHCYNVEHPSLVSNLSLKERGELSTEEWKRVLDKAWAIGIPHIIFTGGEPTLRADLPELIAHAEANGQITGLNTNARRLSDEMFVRQLTEAGLDHVQITL
jgi:sulfatase maturation enzyme AslB (radical SAM superfamily)